MKMVAEDKGGSLEESESDDAPRASKAIEASHLTEELDILPCILLHGDTMGLTATILCRSWIATKTRSLLGASSASGAIDYCGISEIVLIRFLLRFLPLIGAFICLYEFWPNENILALFVLIAALALFFAYWRTMGFCDWRYLLNKARWREKAFEVGGSLLEHFLHALAWGFAVVLSVGLAWPSASADLERLRMRHVSYGPYRVSFQAPPRDERSNIWLLSPLFFISQGVIALSLFGIVVCNSALGEFESGKFDPEDMMAMGYADAAGRSMMLYIFLLFVFAPIYVVSRAILDAVSWKWRIERTRLGVLSFSSNLHPLSFLLDYVIFACLGAGIALAALQSAAQFNWTTPAITTSVLLGLIGICASWRLFFIERLWRKIVISTKAHND